jgi:hypothetical protein
LVKDKIDFVDNNLVYTFNPENKTEAFGLIINPFFFIVNLAIGGGSLEDRMLTIDLPQDFSVRLYRSIPINKGLTLKKK